LRNQKTQNPEVRKSSRPFSAQEMTSLDTLPNLSSAAVCWGEPRENPNRPTCQQRRAPTAAAPNPETRSLRFAPTRAHTQNPAPSRGFGGPTRVAASPSKGDADEMAVGAVWSEPVFVSD